MEGSELWTRDVQIVLHPRGSHRTEVIIDPPSADEVVSQPFLVAGWAADPQSRKGTGVETLHVWAYPARGGDPIFIGATEYGGRRPDVGAALGERFSDSGYGIVVDGLPPDTYDLAVFAWSTAAGGFVPAKTVRVMVGR
jgi:hypothetical protein